MTNSENPKNDDSTSKIDTLRKSIDDIDDKILDLINKRLLLAKNIGQIKGLNNEPILDSSRETTIIKRLSSLTKGHLSNNALHNIFTEIIAASREIQKPQIVTYLGPEATFTHIAAIKHFGHSISFVPQPSIRDIFSKIEKDACHYGVVPVENSIEGTVNYTVDLFYDSDLKICAEIYLAISHDLLSTNGSLDNIRVIYSHPHAFAQCRKWLRRNLPECILEECNSTALAAQKASKEPGSAAIASREAAHIYNLQVTASKIEDFSKNITRFLVIGRNKIRRTGDDKTSIIFVTSHVPGALYRVLQPIAEAGINMAKLESRPTKHENWNYFFSVDIEGHIEDAIVKKTIAEMEKFCLYLNCLGSYPRAQG
ncbi:MAG: prephenate dehydratase [Desulfobacteraceae bacterium]|nr:prephenate dehydratase [Desulfobacteraceae bacterium]MBC2718556.1 prephenate dehydratase [Desulfobacteraceae bacterium]